MGIPIAVMGKEECTPEEYGAARAAGSRVAEEGAILLALEEAVSRAAAAAGRSG